MQKKPEFVKILVQAMHNW